jgi:hypothetical protein
VYGDIRKCKSRNWEKRSKNREDWMRSIKEARAHRVVEPTTKKKKNCSAIFVRERITKRLNH